MGAWAAVAQAAGNAFDTWYNNDQAMERQHDAQGFDEVSMRQNMDFQRSMRQTAFQDQVQDLSKAGLNPMLGYMHASSGAPMPSTSALSSPIGTPGGSSMGHNIASAFAADSQIKVNDAIEDRTRAEAENIRADTANKPIQGENLKQQIAESSVRIEQIWEETKRAGASAALMTQQADNLKAQIPQIQATVKQLTALANLDDQRRATLRQQMGLTDAEIRQLEQVVKANLPELTRQSSVLNVQAQQLGMPGRINEASAQESWHGALGAYLRALSPINNLLNAGPNVSHTTINRK